MRKQRTRSWKQRRAMFFLRMSLMTMPLIQYHYRNGQHQMLGATHHHVVEYSVRIPDLARMTSIGAEGSRGAGRGG